MRIRRTADLERAYADAPEAVQKSLDQRLQFLSLDFRHPSCRCRVAPATRGAARGQGGAAAVTELRARGIFVAAHRALHCPPPNRLAT